MISETERAFIPRDETGIVFESDEERIALRRGRSIAQGGVLALTDGMRVDDVVAVAFVNRRCEAFLATWTVGRPPLTYRVPTVTPVGWAAFLPSTHEFRRLGLVTRRGELLEVPFLVAAGGEVSFGPRRGVVAFDPPLVTLVAARTESGALGDAVLGTSIGGLVQTVHPDGWQGEPFALGHVISVTAGQSADALFVAAVDATATGRLTIRGEGTIEAPPLPTVPSATALLLSAPAGRWQVSAITPDGLVTAPGERDSGPAGAVATPVAASAGSRADSDGLALGPALIADPFLSFPMLRWATASLHQQCMALPLEGMRAGFVLHFLTDLIPFTQACLELGLPAGSATFFYKSEYPYPHQRAVGGCLVDQGVTVRPVEEVPDWVAECERVTPDHVMPILVVEDGGYIAPLLHERRSPLCAHVVGAVEQTTKGLRRIEDWARSATGKEPDFSDVLQFPLVSIPDSEIKRGIEPRLIASQVLQCISGLTSDLSFQGLEVAIVGLGTIGFEVFDMLREQGALVTGFDTDDSRRVRFATRGGRMARSAEEAVRGKRLVIGCTGRRSITSDVIANLQHGVFLVSASSDLVEIDLEYLKAKGTASPLGIKDQDYQPDTPGAGTRYMVGGPAAKQVNLLGNGLPITFWGFPGMPHQGGDLVMTTILIAAAELAARHGTSPFPKAICRRVVDELAKRYAIEAEYWRTYLNQAG